MNLAPIHPPSGHLFGPLVVNMCIDRDVPVVTSSISTSVIVDRISSVVLRGVSHEGRLIGREACDQEQEGNRDTRVRQVQAVSMT